LNKAPVEDTRPLPGEWPLFRLGHEGFGVAAGLGLGLAVVLTVAAGVAVGSARMPMVIAHIPGQLLLTLYP